MVMHSLIPRFVRQNSVVCHRVSLTIKDMSQVKTVCITLPYMNKLIINSMLRTFLGTLSETYNGLGLRGRLLVG
jgi:hypothetical protein